MWNEKKKNSGFYSEFALPERPTPFCGITAGSPGGILFPPMLFPPSALSPRPHKFDDLVKSRNSIKSVIPAEAGIPYS
jgi:hypothetical protein